MTTSSQIASRPSRALSPGAGARDAHPARTTSAGGNQPRHPGDVLLRVADCLDSTLGPGVAAERAELSCRGCGFEPAPRSSPARCPQCQGFDWRLVLRGPPVEVTGASAGGSHTTNVEYRLLARFEATRRRYAAARAALPERWRVDPRREAQVMNDFWVQVIAEAPGLVTKRPVR
jgi:hypothetical protein